MPPGCANSVIFQSTRPVWGATGKVRLKLLTPRISIHAPRVGRDPAPDHAGGLGERISIHAPRVGRDQSVTLVGFDLGISIHAPRVGRDSVGRVWIMHRNPFQSTRPVWGATRASHLSASILEFQSTRPVWGATASAVCGSCTGIHFNPRAPCGARPLIAACLIAVTGFQSTRPVWGATRWYLHC